MIRLRVVVAHLHLSWFGVILTLGNSFDEKGISVLFASSSNIWKSVSVITLRKRCHEHFVDYFVTLLLVTKIVDAVTVFSLLFESSISCVLAVANEKVVVEFSLCAGTYLAESGLIEVVVKG